MTATGFKDDCHISRLRNWVGQIKLNEETKTSLKTKHFLSIKEETGKPKLCSLKKLTFFDALARLIQP